MIFGSNPLPALVSNNIPFAFVFLIIQVVGSTDTVSWLAKHKLSYGILISATILFFSSLKLKSKFKIATKASILIYSIPYPPLSKLVPSVNIVPPK